MPPAVPPALPIADPLRDSLERAVAGRYTVLRELGRGGMGAVYLAQDLSLDRPVAIKVLPPELAVQPTLRERFVREARLAGSLSHPNIIHVHAVEERGDLLAIVMQYVDGETLVQRIARTGPYDPQDVARLMQDIAWALGYAHGRGIVHRDVKPDNLIIERGTGRTLIMDFGIARKEQATSLTEVGQSIGTPTYMSPEQAAAEDVDGRSDVYSLGCVGFFAATGRPPFVAPSAHKLLMMHLTEAAPSIGSVRAGFPEKFDAIVSRCLAKERGERFTTAEALAEAIGDLQLRTREVAPLLRLFHQQTAQSLQALLTLVLLLVAYWAARPQADPALDLLVSILFLTVSITVVIHVFDRVRYAVRRGFTVQDVQTAFTAIGDEIRTAREQLMSDPAERRRNIRRRWFAAIAGFTGGASWPIALWWLSEQGTGGVRRFTGTGALTLILGTVCVGISIAFWATRPVRVTLAQRIEGHFWSSRPGRWIFARAERRYAREVSRRKE